MPVDTVNTLIDALRQSHVLDEDQLASIERDALGKFSQPRDLAKDLIARGWLTKYQARQLLHGHGADLTMGPYKLLERLGSGGMGQVFKALHGPMNRIVALKVVRPELIADPKTLKRFRREVQAAAQLNHPNIVTVFDASQLGTMHFLAMEYIDGVDFADAVKGSGPLPIGTACEFVRQAALGLHHAHQRGLIHRDIKPSNLLVSRNPPGIVKILDLGLARPKRLSDEPRDGETSLTLDGSVVGTPDYMSPEQGKNSSGVDHRSDLYSLGCTLYFLLTADVPFPKGSAMEKLIQHQLEEPCPIEMLRDEIPEELIAVLRKMMAKKPEDRYQSGEEVAAALEPFCRGASQPIQGSPASSLPTRVSLETPTTTASPFNFGSPQAQIEMSTLMLKKQDRRQWIIIGGAVLAMLLAILIISITSSGKNNRKPPDPPPAPAAPKTPNKHVGRYNLLESATLRENLPCPPRFLRSTAVLS